MRDYFKKKTWIITGLMFVIAFGLSSAIVYYEFSSKDGVKVSQASSTDNVSGWAWNSNIGWISFNCTNDSPACGASNYGVKVDLNTGNFSGYAWSSNVGFIDFSPSSGYPEAPNYSARYDFAAGAVTGWAKILTMGDNGWIKLSGAWSGGVTINQASGEFSGWAWNANTDGSGIGWISFNCANETPACSTSNYKVIGDINRPPSVSNLTAPNWNYTEAKNDAKRANLQFSFVDPDNGSFGSKYQIIIKKSDDSLVLDTGECTGYATPTSKCKFDISPCLTNGTSCQYPLGAELAYGTPYKWSVQVWDNNGAASSLTSYNTSPDTPSQADDGVASTFTTYKHKFPAASPSCFPEKPSKGEKVKCSANSQRFFSAAPEAVQACTASTCDWLWTKPAGASIDDSATSTPTLIFNNVGSNMIILRVTDKTDTGAEPYYSEFTVNIDVNAKLPKWKEVKPE